MTHIYPHHPQHPHPQVSARPPLALRVLECASTLSATSFLAVYICLIHKDDSYTQIPARAVTCYVVAALKDRTIGADRIGILPDTSIHVLSLRGNKVDRRMSWLFSKVSCSVLWFCMHICHLSMLNFKGLTGLIRKTSVYSLLYSQESMTGGLRGVKLGQASGMWQNKCVPCEPVFSLYWLFRYSADILW